MSKYEQKFALLLWIEALTYEDKSVLKVFYFILNATTYQRL